MNQIALVGESWGAEEAIARAPFVGPAGRCLNQLLRTAGIEREACWVGNVFDARPPNDDLGTWCAGARERAGWGAAYALAAWPALSKGKWLRPEHTSAVLSLPERVPASARVIVALGGTAAWALLRAGGIADWRGTLTRLPDGRWVLPTYHPAAVLRQWPLFHTAAMDLARARAIVESDSEPTLLAPVVQTASAPEDISRFHAEWPAGELCSIDIETSRGQIDTVAVGSAERVLVIPFVDTATASRSWWAGELHEVMAIAALGALCADARVGKVLQNGVYDAYWLWRQWGIRLVNYAHDTRLMHHALYPELPKSLAWLAPSYCAIAPWKHTRGWGAVDETGKE